MRKLALFCHSLRGLWKWSSTHLPLEAYIALKIFAGVLDVDILNRSRLNDLLEGLNVEVSHTDVPVFEDILLYRLRLVIRSVDLPALVVQKSNKVLRGEQCLVGAINDLGFRVSKYYLMSFVGNLTYRDNVRP